MTKKKESERKIVNVLVNYLTPDEFETSLVNIKNMIEELIIIYGEKSYFRYDSSHYEPYDSVPSQRFNLMISREENDKEYIDRLKQERLRTEIIDKRELEEYKKLKLKFEGKK